MNTPEFINEFEIVYRPTKLQVGSITSPIDCATTARNILGTSNLFFQEFMYAFYMNRNNEVISYKCISIGSRSGVMCDFKIIFGYALKVGAESLYLLHNHPSGNLKPSPQDERMFKRAVEVGNLLECPVIDSIIIAPEKGFYSTVNDLAYPNF